MKIEMFNVGWLTSAAGIWRSGETEPDRAVRIPVPAYLIETADERVLVDTGLHPEAAADARSYYAGSRAPEVFRLEQQQSLADQVDFGSVTRVVLTHLHFDHAGGLALVPESVPLYIQRREWEAGSDEAAIARNFFHRRDYALGERELRLVDGDHDLLGDGSIELIATPGHTPGHQSVRAGDVVIAGDVVHFASGLDDHRFPAFGDDLGAQAESAQRLRALRDSGVDVRPGHDPDELAPGPVAQPARSSA